MSIGGTIQLRVNIVSPARLPRILIESC